MKKSIWFYLSVCGLALGISAWAMAAPPAPSDLHQAREGTLANDNHDNGVKRGHNKTKPTPPGLSKQGKELPNHTPESGNGNEKSLVSRFLGRDRNQS